MGLPAKASVQAAMVATLATAPEGARGNWLLRGWGSLVGSLHVVCHRRVTHVVAAEKQAYQASAAVHVQLSVGAVTLLPLKGLDDRLAAEQPAVAMMGAHAVTALPAAERTAAALQETPPNPSSPEPHGAEAGRSSMALPASRSYVARNHLVEIRRVCCPARSVLKLQHPEVRHQNDQELHASTMSMIECL